MEPGDENFFENLATGKVNAAGDGNGGGGADSDGDLAGAGFEVELAKAETGAVASRAAKTTHVTSRAAQAAEKNEWDEEPEGQLTVDVYQTPDEIVVESAIAGVRPEDIDINVTSDSVSIKGLRYHEHAVGDKDYLYQECYWGRFARSIILPQEVDPESAAVTFKNGILAVRLPKVNKKKTKKLRVRID